MSSKNANQTKRVSGHTNRKSSKASSHDEQLTPQERYARRRHSSSNSGYGGHQQQQHRKGEKVERRGTTDMRELTAALMSAREGTGDIIEILLRSTFRPRLPGLTKMVSRLGKDGCWKKSLELFEAAVSIGLCEPDTALTNAAISACDKGGQWQKALEYFDKFERMGIQRDAITYSATINALGKGKQWEGALRVFCHMKTYGIRADVITCCSLINALEKSGQWEMAECLFYHMKGDPHPSDSKPKDESQDRAHALPPYTSPNSVLKTILRHNSSIPSSHLATVNENVTVLDDDFGSLGFICSPIENSSEQEHSEGFLLTGETISDSSEHSMQNMTGDAASRRDSLSSVGTSHHVTQDLLLEFAHLSTEEKSRNEGLKRSISCFPEVSETSNGITSLDVAKGIDFSHAYGVTPNRVCCNALMGAFARARPTQWRKAVDFLAYLWEQDDSIHPDIITYNTALKACSNAFQLKQIEILFADMSSRGITPNMATFQFIIDAATETRSSLFLKSTIQWLSKYPRLKDNCASQIVVACVRCNMHSEAMQVFEEALVSHPETISESSEAIFGALIFNNDSLGVIRLLDLMCELRVLPSINVCSSLIDFLCRQNSWKQAINLLETMISSDSMYLDRMLSVSPANAILRSMIRVVKESEEEQNEAKMLFPDALKVFFWLGSEIPSRPNQETYCHMIQICTIAGEYRQALAVSEMMSNQHYLPDQDTVSSILLANLETGEIAQSISLVTQLILNDVTLDKSVISRAFTTCLEQQEWHLAMMICETLEKQNRSQADIRAMYTTLLKVSSEYGENKVAMKILAAVQEKSIQIDPMIAAQIMGTSAMKSHDAIQGSGNVNSFGSLFFTNIQDTDATVVQFQEFSEQKSLGEGTRGQKLVDISQPRQLNQDVAFTLIRSWIKLDVSIETKNELVRLLERTGDDGLTSLDMLRLVQLAAESGSTDAAIDICSSLHAADILKFYQIPPIYSVKHKNGNQWVEDINLIDISSDHLLVQIVMSSWLYSAKEAVSWGCNTPSFDRFRVRLSGSSAADFENLSLGLIKLLTTGQSVLLKFKNNQPVFCDSHVVTLFQEDETHGGIEIDVSGLDNLS